MASYYAFVLVATLALLTSIVLAQPVRNADVNVKVVYTWRASNDTNYPSDAHFSPMVCAVSKTDVLFVRDSKASEGFRIIAETGGSSTLENELNGDTNVKQVETLRGTAIGTGSDEIETTLQVSSEYSYVACVSMIAPSPGKLPLLLLSLDKNEVMICS